MTLCRYVVKAVVVTLPILLTGNIAAAQSIRGTATYRERITLPQTAIFEAVLEDVSRAGAPAEEIGRTRVVSPGNPPIRFEIAYDTARIQSNRSYVVRARIVVDDRLMFSTDTATPVITRGSPTSVSMMLRRVATGPATSSKEMSSRSGRGRGPRWRAWTQRKWGARFGTH